MKKNLSDITYFAYGSNMLSKVIKNRRGILYKEKKTALLNGWQLLFNCQGFNKYEPAFANIKPKKECKVEGVLYSMSHSEFIKLLNTEAGMYDVMDIDATISTGENIHSITLTSKKTIDNACPSHRYLSLLIEGAKENNLSEEYISALSTTQHVPKPSSYDFVYKLASLYSYAKFYF